MARFCICGCGEELLTKDGGTDYDRKFFSAKCRNADKSQHFRDHLIAASLKPGDVQSLQLARIDPIEGRFMEDLSRARG